MTWRELFRRAWLVLRLRRKTFQICMDCGVPLIATSERIEYNRCHECYELDCLALREEMQRRARERETCPTCGAKASGSWAFADTAYCVGVGGCGAVIRLGPSLGALQNVPGMIDPTLLQNQIGAPIRVSQPDAIINLGSAIGSAIGYCRPSGFIW